MCMAAFKKINPVSGIALAGEAAKISPVSAMGLASNKKSRKASPQMDVALGG